MRCQMLRQRPRRERSPCHAALMLKKIRLAGIVIDEPPLLQQRHRIAREMVTRRRTAGCERRRDDACGRGEHGTMGGEDLRPAREGAERWQAYLGNEVAAQAIQDNNDDSTQWSPPRLNWLMWVLLTRRAACSMRRGRYPMAGWGA